MTIHSHELRTIVDIGCRICLTISSTSAVDELVSGSAEHKKNGDSIDANGRGASFVSSNLVVGAESGDRHGT